MSPRIQEIIHLEDFVFKVGVRMCIISWPINDMFQMIFLRLKFNLETNQIPACWQRNSWQKRIAKYGRRLGLISKRNVEPYICNCCVCVCQTRDKRRCALLA